jgi:hypothetical protein
MKCPNCSTENPANAKFCKSCRSELSAGYKKCPNGHDYLASLSSCPYCPSNRNSGEMKTVVEGRSGGSSDKTVVEGSGSSGSRSDKTQVMGSPSSGRSDKTMILNPDGSVPQSAAQKQQASMRKMVGWLVTFDIQPIGMDYRLYVGRNIIGREAKCDIVINQQGVSAEHSVILYREGKFIIQDQLSMNGTYVNEIQIEDKVYLNNDDIIRLGNINLKLKII